MADIPGIAELFPKLLSQCGLVTAVLVAGIIWLAVQLAKERSEREKERSEMLKLYTEQRSSLEKMAISNGRLEAVLLAVRGGGGDDD